MKYVVEFLKNFISLRFTKINMQNIVQVLQVVGDKFAAVSSDINGIGLHIKPGCSKISVWTTKITSDNYKNIMKIG